MRIKNSIVELAIKILILYEKKTIISKFYLSVIKDVTNLIKLHQLLAL